MKGVRFLRYLLLVFSLVALSMLAAEMYIPSLPGIRDTMHAGRKAVQLTLSLYMIAFGCVQLFGAPFADRFGRKHLILVVVIGGGLSSLLAMLAGGVTMLLVARVLQGLFFGMIVMMARIATRDAFKGHRLIQVRSINAIGGTIIMSSAPTLGGWLDEHFSWRASFLLIVILAAVITCMISIWFTDLHATKNKDALNVKLFIQRSMKFLKRASFWGYSVMVGSVTGMILAYQITSPFLVEDILGWRPIEYGYLSLIIAAGFFIGGLLTPMLSKRFQKLKVLFWSALLMLASALMMLLWALIGGLSVVALMVPMFIQATAGACVAALPYALICEAYPDSGAELSGFYGFIKFVVAGLISAIIAQFHVKNQIPLSCVIVSIALLILGALFVSRHRTGHISAGGEV